MTTLNPYYPGKMAAIRMDRPKPKPAKPAPYVGADFSSHGADAFAYAMSAMKPGLLWEDHERATNSYEWMRPAEMPSHLDYAGLREEIRRRNSAEMQAADVAGTPLDYGPMPGWFWPVVAGGCALFWGALGVGVASLFGWTPWR